MPCAAEQGADGGAVAFGEGHEHGNHPHKYCERQQQRNEQQRRSQRHSLHA